MAKRSLAKRRTSTGKSGEVLVASAERTGTVPIDGSLAGHADRGMTLAGLYDTGAYHLLRPEVRLRIFCDVLVSVVSLQSSPRVRESGTPLGVLPATIAIGLDGVAHLDLRNARRCGSGELTLDRRYLAPELLAGERCGPAADVFALGVLGWEALTGARWTSPASAPQRAGSGGASPRRRATPAARSAVSPGATVASPSGSSRAAEIAQPQGESTRWVPPRDVAWPSDVAWAPDFGKAMQRAMALEPEQRPGNARSLLSELHWLDRVKLAQHREIADVMQGITKLSSLYMPEPELPRVDASCQSGWVDRLATCDCLLLGPELCNEPQPRPLRREPERRVSVPATEPQPVRAERRAPEPPAAPAPAPSRQRNATSTSWLVTLWLLIAAASLVFGYLVSVFLRH